MTLCRFRLEGYGEDTRDQQGPDDVVDEALSVVLASAGRKVNKQVTTTTQHSILLYTIYTATIFNMEDNHPPLSYESSATTTHPHIATSLPPEVVSCLKNSRFVSHHHHHHHHILPAYSNNCSSIWQHATTKSPTSPS